jgi:hypothetical protein
MVLVQRYFPCFQSVAPVRACSSFPQNAAAWGRMRLTGPPGTFVTSARKPRAAGSARPKLGTNAQAAGCHVGDGDEPTVRRNRRRTLLRGSPRHPSQRQAQPRFTTSCVAPVLKRQRSSVSFRDLTAECQPDARAPWFGGKKRNKHVRRILNARAVVSHPNMQL